MEPAHMYTGRQLAFDLDEQLRHGYDPVRIAKWAFERSIDPDTRDRAPAVTNLLDLLSVMEMGPEFHLSESELREIVNRHINSA